MKKTLSLAVTVLYRDFSDFCESILQESGLSKGLLFFLLYIGKHPGCTHGEVSAYLGSDNGHTTRCVNRMIEGGFVRRDASALDRRVRRLWLTPQGAKTFHRCYNLFLQWDRERFGNVPEKTKTQARLALAALLEESGCFPQLSSESP